MPYVANVERSCTSGGAFGRYGVGCSIGGRGFRVGQDAKGRSYTAAPIPGTGLYSRTYSGQRKAAARRATPASGAATERNTGIRPAVGMLALAFMAGGLVVFILTPHPTTPPPATPPATVSEPVTPLQPIRV
jgi:hypothetical protein